jgi:hypothetical protein
MTSVPALAVRSAARLSAACQKTLAYFLFGDTLFLGPVRDRQLQAEDVVGFFGKANCIPLLRIGVFGDVARSPCHRPAVRGSR